MNKDSYQIINSDCVEALKDLITQGIQVDSIVTDPPYAIEFMGNKWDCGDIVHDVEFWKLCLQILKPGGHLLAFSATRTYHRMVVAIEDAGFEIRDCISWIYGQGFPKSLNISKAIDKMAGADREVVGQYKYPDGSGYRNPINSSDFTDVYGNQRIGGSYSVTAAATDLAKQWDGWGTALKPAFEPIVLARKPLSEKTIVENVLKHGTGGINVDRCRVALSKEDPEFRISHHSKDIPHSKEKINGILYIDNPSEDSVRHNALGRFPANLIHDGSEEVEAEFVRQSEGKRCAKASNGAKKNNGTAIWGNGNDWSNPNNSFLDSGSASRFFYTAKASKHDRLGSKHPTVKPVNLMKYLCRLVTPPNGLVLDPFAGSGTTGHAAILEGFRVIMIEREEEYYQDILNRMSKVESEMEPVQLSIGV